MPLLFVHSDRTMVVKLSRPLKLIAVLMRGHPVSSEFSRVEGASMPRCYRWWEWVARSVVVALVAVATCTGCGDSSSAGNKPVFPTQGTVTYLGQGAAGVVVTLHPSGANDPAAIYPHGTTDASGAFQLTSYVLNDGAPVGTYQVSLKWPDTSYQPRTPEERENMLMGERPDRFRGRYLNPATSNLTVTITEGENQLPPFDLR